TAVAQATSLSVLDQAPSLTVSIDGTAREGQVLSAVPVPNETDDTLSYAWRSNGSLVGTDATYTVAETDEGFAITLTVTDVTDFSGGTATAAATSGSVIDAAPSITASISGTAQEGKTLTASVTGAEGDDALSYKWVTGSTTLGTASTYVVAEADEGNTI